MFREIATGKIFRKRSAGKGRFSGMFLWQPMKKVWFFYVPDRGQRSFWLDDYGFEKI